MFGHIFSQTLHSKCNPMDQVNISAFDTSFFSDLRTGQHVIMQKLHLKLWIPQLAVSHHAADGPYVCKSYFRLKRINRDCQGRYKLLLNLKMS